VLISGVVVGSFLQDCCPWKHGWRHITPLSSLKALQIRLSTPFFGKTSQHCLEFWAVIEVVQMNRFMKEDVIQGIVRGTFEAI
jgi:hypothetical protein